MRTCETASVYVERERRCPPRYEVIFVRKAGDGSGGNCALFSTPAWKRRPRCVPAWPTCLDLAHNGRPASGSLQQHGAGIDPCPVLAGFLESPPSTLNLREARLRWIALTDIPGVYGGSPSADYEGQTRLAARVEGLRSPWYACEHNMHSARTVGFRCQEPHHVRGLSAPGLPHGWVSVHGPAFDKPHQLHPDSRRPFPSLPSFLLSPSFVTLARAFPFERETTFSLPTSLTSCPTHSFRWHFVTIHFL